MQIDSNLAMKKYGISVRLVNEDDAEFIVRLRTDSRIGSFLHSTSTDVETQRLWIRKYKEREEKGTEYYLFFYKENTPIGVSRIVLFNGFYCNSGSWVCAPDSDLKDVIASNFITQDFALEILKAKVCLFEVVKENKAVWKFHEQKGAKRYFESDTHYFYHLTYNDYCVKRDKLIKLMKL